MNDKQKILVFGVSVGLMLGVLSMSIYIESKTVVYSELSFEEKMKYVDDAMRDLSQKMDLLNEEKRLRELIEDVRYVDEDLWRTDPF